jgi:TPR repeat protein
MSEPAPERAGLENTESVADVGSLEPVAARRLSRRRLLGMLAIAPLQLPLLSSRAQKATAKAVSSSSFRPDDLFAGTSLVGDLQRARGGDVAATIRAGFKYYTGMAGREDIRRARSYFLAASRVSPAGAAWLGYLDVRIHNGGGAALRKRASFQKLVSAAQAGDPVAQTLLGRVYERGLAGYRPRPDKAQPLYVSAAPKFSLAKTYLGRLLVKQKQYPQAMTLFQEAAKAGDTTAMIAIADLYSRGKQPAKMASPIKRWLRLAGQRGDRTALYILGTQYQKGSPGFPADRKRALSFLRSAAVRGHKPAQLALSAAFAAGDGGGSNAASIARYWARKASLPSLNRSGPPPAPGKPRPDMAS